MTISPDTLNHLYNYGIIDHVPVGIYDTAPTAPLGYENPYRNIKAQAFNNRIGFAYAPYAKYKTIGGPTYLDAAMSGNLYRNPAGDAFIPHNPYLYNINSLDNLYAVNENYGQGMDLEVMINGEEGKEIRQSIVKAGRNAKEKFINAHPMVKGLSALGLVTFSLVALLRGKKGIFK